MPAYNFGDYGYFNNMTDKYKTNNIGFILNQRHEMYIISLLKIMEETFLSFPKIFVKMFLEPWISANIQSFAQSPKIFLWNQHS